MLLGGALILAAVRLVVRPATLEERFGGFAPRPVSACATAPRRRRPLPALRWAVPPNVRLLGRPDVEWEGAPVEPPFGKPWALLVVLAASGGWVDREELVSLLWPDYGEARARANLRKLLSRNVAALPFAGGIEAEPTRLRWPVPCDVVAFREALADGRLAQAPALYRGPVLHGLRAGDLSDLEDWIATRREELGGLWRDAGTTLAAQAAAEGAFRTFAERLAREVGAEPSPATRALAEQASAAPIAAAPRSTPRTGARGLPKHATPFVGRAVERARLAEVLLDPACRLVTITAPGGFGKARLALAVAAELEADFADGVAFVPFAAVHDVAQVPFTLADARWLVTSRERLDLEGELRFELRGLALP